ncbi:GA module-containing protein [Gardnerella sp. KA00288]
MKDAEEDNIANQDPLGKYVHVKYTANLNSSDNSFDKWAFRPMWWYGVPAGLTDVHDINYSRFEKYTGDGNPVPSRPGLHREDENVTKHYANSKDWKGISNFYITDPHKLASMNGLKTLLGIDGGDNKGYDNTGNTAGNWKDFYDATNGMQSMFVDWESAGKRYYEMTYVAELTDEAWKQRDVKPLRFAAGVYRFAGNWHIATGQIHHAPKIADSLKVKYPDRTPVAKVNQLTDEEQGKVKDAIYNANKDATPHFSDLLDGTAGIEVAADGTATLKFKDNTTLTMPGKLLVMEQKRDRDLYPPTYPAPIGVVNPKSLSDADQKAIIDGFKTANKDKDFLNKVKTNDSEAYKFDNDKQTLTITYTDGSTITVPYSSLVYQGATIADWAPYSVPDVITVDNLTNISDAEVTAIKKAFDDANSGLDVYTNAKTKDSAGYLTIDKRTGNATIKWADGSTTEIASWQFLKEKEKTTPAPEPSTPVAEEKTFRVDVPAKPTETPLDLFNKNASIPPDAISSYQTLLLSKKAYDAKTGAEVKLKSVKFNFANGDIDFSVDGYKDKSYPISLFYRKSTDSKPTKGTGNNGVYAYNLTPVIADIPSKPTTEEKQKALAQFVKDNYNKTISGVTSYTLTDSDTPVSGTNYMWKYKQVADGHNGTGVVSIKINDDGSLAVKGMENNVANEHYIDVPVSKLYVNPERDRLLAKAKELWNSRDNRLDQKDLTKAGINDKISDLPNSLDNKSTSDLYKFIKNLINAKHIERKYNPIPEIEVADKNKITDDDFKKAIKAFLDANYTGAGEVSNTTYSMTSALKPKPGTADMEPYDANNNPVGITTISKGTGSTLTVTCNDNTTFTVNVTFKNKQDTPAGNDLDKLKKQAKELINRNPKLTDKQKEDFKNQIDKADTKDKIQEILKKANEQAGNNNVTPDQLKEKEKKEKEKRENEKREKEQQNKLAEDKTKANEALNSLSNLTTDGDSSDKNKLSGEIDKAKTSEDVKKILEKAKAINDARGALKEGALPFLSHGKSDSNDDKALKELIGADPSKKDSALTSLETALNDANATADSINKALDEAKRQNGINEQAARQAANAKIAEFENKLEAAEKVLNDNTTIKAEDKTKATTDIATAKSAITTAKESVKKATKPSEMLTQLTNVETKFKDADGKVNDAVNNAQKENKKQNTNDPDAKAFEKEKNDAKGEIDKIPGLSKEEKDKYKEQIDQSTHKGDPEAIVNQAKKHKKIEAALKAIDNFEHLNNAQKEAFKRIIEDTDASDHKNADGTTSDDIDDALANAANTDNAMARLGELEKKAEAFQKEADGKYSKLDSTKPAEKKQKDDFDNYLKDATTLTTPDKGDAKGADEVNTLYDDLLKAMRAIDPKAQSAGLKTDALSKEIESDKKFKPSETEPKTPGNAVYNTSSKAKKDAFDAALTAAEQALTNATKKDLDISTADREAAEQKKVDEALDKLVKARLALDGVDTTKLQTEIDKESATTSSDAYKYDSQENQNNYNKALQEAKDLIDKLTGKKKAAQGEEDVTTKTQAEKQKLVDEVLAKLKAAEEALKGKKPIEPTPTPTPTPSVDKSHLQQGIDNGSDVHNSDEYNNAPSDKKQAYDHALDHANEVNNDPNATQDQVNQAVEDLKKAENDLKPTPSPLPTPVPGGHEDSGFGVNDNAPTTVDKGELNVQIDSAEADSQPGNAGNGNAGNAGNANSGNAANANANSASNAANSAAVNAAVENSPAVKQADAQVSKAQAALDAALAEAKKVAADPNATQAQVDAAAQKLSAARKALASAKAHAAEVRASVRAQVLKSGVSKLSKTGSNVSVFGLLATVAAAGAAFFVSKRRGVSRHSNN